MHWAVVRHWFNVDPAKLTFAVLVELAQVAIRKIEKMKDSKGETPQDRAARYIEETEDEDD